MGKIIRNGVEYSGAVEAATAVNYDGSISGLKAQTVQEAIDELSASGLGGNISYDLLATNTSNLSSGGEISLNDSIENFTFLLFMFTENENVNSFLRTAVYPVSVFKERYNDDSVASLDAMGSTYMNFGMKNENTLKYRGTNNVQIRFIYGIKSTGGSSESTTYSTEETVCGTWIDGSPIYKKTYTATVDISKALTTYNLDMGLKVENILPIKMYGMTKIKDNYYCTIPSTDTPTDDKTRLVFELLVAPNNNTINGFYFQCTAGTNRYGSYDIYATIEYVKKS